MGFLVLAALAMGLSSCAVERKLARQFIESDTGTVALVMLPEYVFKTNLKTYEHPGIDTLPEPKRDSILYAGSTFLNILSDSVILNRFNEKLTGQLQKYGYTIMEESRLDSFMVMHPGGLVVNVAQVSIEEFVHPYTFDYDMVDEYYTVKDIDLNALSMNIWIELSQLNSIEKNNLFFTSDFITDDLEGYFRQYLFTGKIEFEYTLDTLTSSDIYLFMDSMGKKCAIYLHDYLLNDFIRENIPENTVIEPKPVRWDPDRKQIEFRNPDDGFIKIEQAGPR